MFHTKFVGMCFICIHNKFCSPGSDGSLSPSILKERYRFCIVPVFLFFCSLQKFDPHKLFIQHHCCTEIWGPNIALTSEVACTSMRRHCPDWCFSWFFQFSRQKQKWYLKEAGCCFLLHPLNPLLINSPITSHNTIWVVESFIK